MQETKLEVGAIFEGKVTGITKFGAFVDLGNGKTGMVHISEVAPVFVKEIRDFVTEGQTVKVKIIGINEDGKISLSMKRQTKTRSSSAPRAAAMRTADPRARTIITAAKLLPRCRAPQDRAIMSGVRAKTPALLKI